MSAAWKEYDVTLTLELSMSVRFSRDTEEELEPITKSDAIENAIGYLPPEFFASLEHEGIAYATPIRGEATEL